jgi:7,8-dihydropterin-6-yl-methyl-4-(beta-D-ribofuranosyl)aminobenzene 5'-phosphate synthase
MKVSIKILVENTVPLSDLAGEHGFAALIDVDNTKILLDVGNKGTIFENSRLLGVDLKEIDSIVLSHGHYDHTGALLAVLKKTGARKVYAHSNLFAHRLVVVGGQVVVEPGTPFNKKQLHEAGGDLIFVDFFNEIYPQVFFSGEIPRLNGFEDVGGRGTFKVEQDGELLDDMIPDDIALIIDHPDGLIIISGCAHSGLLNIIDYAMNKTGHNKVLAFIGGTHLLDASEERLDKTILALKESYKVEKLVVCHCTGFHATSKLYNQLGSQVIKGEVGMQFNF